MLKNHLAVMPISIPGVAQNAAQSLHGGCLDRSANHPQSGFMLIEVMVAVVVLSLGLLGLAGLQAVNLKANANASLRSQAVILAADMLDRVRANSSNVASYALAMHASAPTLGVTPTVANSDLSTWLTNVADAMPGGDGSIVVNGRTVTVTIQWSERAMQGEASSVYTYSLPTTLPG